MDCVPNCALCVGSTCEKCLDGYYKDSNNNKCVACHSTCKTCNGPNNN